MQYRINPKNGDKLSALGYGCMRFTKKGAFIDQEKAEREMLHALENGVNYFDTAYTYPGNEAAVGKFLAKGYRDKVYLATKLPQYLVKSYEDFDKFFYEQLKRLQTDHIDYYLLHMLSDFHSWERLVDLGIKEWIDEKKKSGQIINIGFSYHGGSAGFIAIVDAYDFDFCQIQFNYLDVHGQPAKQVCAMPHQRGCLLSLWSLFAAADWSGGCLKRLRPSGKKHLLKGARQNGVCVGFGIILKQQ